MEALSAIARGAFPPIIRVLDNAPVAVKDPGYVSMAIFQDIYKRLKLISSKAEKGQHWGLMIGRPLQPPHTYASAIILPSPSSIFSKEHWLLRTYHFWAPKMPAELVAQELEQKRFLSSLCLRQHVRLVELSQARSDIDGAKVEALRVSIDL